MKFADFLNESKLLTEARGVPGLEKGKTYSVGASDSKFVEDLVFLGFAVGEEEKIKYDNLKDLFKGEDVKNLKELEAKRKEERINYYASFGNDRGNVSYAAYLADGKWLLGSGSGKVKVTLVESLQESKFESIIDLQDALKVNKRKFKVLVKALQDNYADDDSDDEKFDVDSFMYSVKKSLTKAGASEVAKVLNTEGDLESFSEYLDDGDDLDTSAESLFQDQKRNDVAKAIIKFVTE